MYIYIYIPVILVYWTIFRRQCYKESYYNISGHLPIEQPKRSYDLGNQPTPKDPMLGARDTMCKRVSSRFRPETMVK